MISPDEAREMTKSDKPHEPTVKELTSRIEQLKAELAKKLDDAKYEMNLGDYHIEVEQSVDGFGMSFESHDGDWDRKGWFHLSIKDFRTLISDLYMRYCRE